ncbi:MAG: hypothetical protein PF904_03340 [Kiritimatiellae bacterium]|jgi:hypothetical protein|nr:hypothetical protein [Kiritimatiellia bacterium]
MVAKKKVAKKRVAKTAVAKTAVAKKRAAKTAVVKTAVAKTAVAKKRAAVRPAQPKVVPAKPKSTRKTKKKQYVGSCFILMPFKEPFEMYYNVIIRPAVSAANLDPLRGDSLFTPTPIMGDVWNMIQEAKVLVAELTYKNANVFYELGLAHALGKPVILISETMEDVPFDLQQLRVILYDKDDPTWGNKLKSAITTALEETLASSVEAVPAMFRKRVKSQAPEDSDMSLRLLQLERRIASLGPEDAVRKRRFERGLDWERVTRYIAQLPPHPEKPKFSRREHAVAWALNMLHHGATVADVRTGLREQVGEREADTIMKHAADESANA